MESNLLPAIRHSVFVIRIYIRHNPLDKPLKFPVNLFAKMFLLFSQTLLQTVLSILEIGKRRQFVEIPPGRFGSSRPSLREGIVLE